MDWGMDAAGKVMLMFEHLEGERRRLDEADAAADAAAAGGAEGDDGRTPAERDAARAKRDAARAALKACAREWAPKFQDFLQRLDAHVGGVPPPDQADEEEGDAGGEEEGEERAGALADAGS